MEVTVSFNANGGEGKMEDQIFEAEEVAPLNKNEFEKEGHAFIGWSTSKRGEVEYEDEEDYYAEEDSTLYAIWEENEFVVTFNANGGKGKMEDQIFIKDEEQELNPNEFTKEGYEFIGWALEKKGDVELEDEEECIVNEDVTLYAVWEKSEVTVTFNANGGKGEMEVQVFEKEEVKPLSPNEFTRKGYIFVGWALEKKGEVEYENEEEYIAEEDITLYAVWERIAALASSDTWYTKGKLDIEKSQITSIEIKDEGAIEEYVKSWDASYSSAKNTVTAYLVDNELDDETYKLYLVGNGTGSIIANSDSSDLFGNKKLEKAFSNVTEIIGLELLDTSDVRDMSNMFANCKSLTKLDLSNFNTANLSNNTDMFNGMNKLQEVIIGEEFSFESEKYGACTLPVPDEEYIEDADGKWYNTESEEFEVEDIPSNLEETYYASKDLVPEEED